MTIIEDSVKPYLNGEQFNNGLAVKIAAKQKLVNRIDYLCDYARGKRIVHVGCVDHIPLITEKLKNNTWLHRRLDEVSKEVLGIDNSLEGIQYMKEQLGYDNVVYEDILEGDIHESLKREWDSMIMGEILEHVDNPVAFLSRIRERYSTYVKELVITVPNALSIKNSFYAVKHTEYINTDHRYWFTPYTLTKILIRAGFKPLYHDFTTYYPVSNRNPIRKWFLKSMLNRYPAFRGNLVAVAAFE
jgi:hypothetical protein